MRKGLIELDGVVELTRTRQMHMAPPDSSGNPKQGTRCVGLGSRIFICWTLSRLRTRRGWEKKKKVFYLQCRNRSIMDWLKSNKSSNCPCRSVWTSARFSQTLRVRVANCYYLPPQTIQDGFSYQVSKIVDFSLFFQDPCNHF